MEYSFMQQYWWFLVSLLGALLVFLMFVQGANSMIFSLGKDEAGKKMVINSTGVHIYYPGHFWWSVLRFFPALLQYKFRRRLLVVDDHPLLFCPASGQL